MLDVGNSDSNEGFEVAIYFLPNTKTPYFKKCTSLMCIFCSYFFRFESTFYDLYNVILAAIIRVFYDALQYVSIRLPRSGSQPTLLNPFHLFLDPCHGLGFVPDLWPKSHFLANPLQKILQILRSLCMGNPIRDMTISPHISSRRDIATIHTLTFSKTFNTL